MTLEVLIEAPAEFFKLFSFKDASRRVIAAAKKKMDLEIGTPADLEIVTLTVKSEVYVFKVTNAECTDFTIRAPANLEISDIVIPDLEISPRVILRGLSKPPIFPGKRVLYFHALDFYVNDFDRKSLLRTVQNSRSDFLVFWGITPSLAPSLDFAGFRVVFIAASSIQGLPDIPVINLQSEIPTTLPELECPAELSGILREIEEVLIFPLTNPILFERFGVKVAPRVLLHGSGQSAVVSIVASRMGGRPVVRVPVSQLFGKYLGSTERRIQKVFKMASSQSPCLLVLEDVHLLVALREEEDEGLSGTFNRALAALLTGLDGVDADRSVAVLATSALPPHQLEPAIIRPGRLETWIDLG